MKSITEQKQWYQVIVDQLPESFKIGVIECSIIDSAIMGNSTITKAIKEVNRVFRVNGNQ